jgi:N-acetylglucosamine-6-phosphate deacetylase
MTPLRIQNVRVLRPGQGVIGVGVDVDLDSGRITGVLTAPAERTPAAADRRDIQVDGGGRLLTPGLIDVHTHGLERHVYEAGPQALRAGLLQLPKFGVTCVLPTLYRVMSREKLGQLRDLAEALDAGGGGQGRRVRTPGFHLEGPFLALPGAGAATVPGDLELLSLLHEATGGKIAAMSISPDTPGILPVIERVVGRGGVAFMTHTRASVAQTEAAIDAGARHATHFYDVFPLPDERDPGVRPCGAVEAILADERVSVDFIADGVHVEPVAIRAALAAKGCEGVLLITDSNIGAGLPAGVHDTPWGFPVRVKEGDGARIDLPGDARHGGLAGSALTMDLGMSNLLKWLPRPEHEVWAMGTRSVARRLGLPDLGDIRAGAMADLVLWDRDEASGRLRACKTWIGGQLAYDAIEAGATGATAATLETTA